MAEKVQNPCSLEFGVWVLRAEHAHRKVRVEDWRTDHCYDDEVVGWGGEWCLRIETGLNEGIGKEEGYRSFNRRG